MQGDPTRRQTQPKNSPAFEEWYAVTGGGASALRIAPGLTVGETAAGALALNDPEPAHQWVEFVVNECGEPWVTIITRDKSLLVNGATFMRHQLGVGAQVRLPGNTLYISRDIRMPPAAGAVLEVVPRQVPGRPQDLVGAGWEEALAAVREPAPATPAEADADQTELLEPRGAAGRTPDPRAEEARAEADARAAARSRAAEARQRDDDATAIAMTVAEPRRSYRPRRRSGGGRRAAVMLMSLVLAAVTVAGVIAVLLSMQPDGLGRFGNFDPAAILDEARRGLPLDPQGEPAVSGDQARSDTFDGTAAEPLATPEEHELPAEAGRAEAGRAEAGRADAGEEPTSLPAPTADPAVASAQQPAAAAPGDAVPVAPAAPAGGVAENQVALLPRSAQPGETETTTAEAPAAAAAEDPAVEQPAAAPSPARDPDWRLVRARELLEAGYITFPPQDNAVAYLERLLAVEPNNAEGLALLDECTTRLIDAAVRAHDQGLDYEARNTLEEVLGFDPDNPEANRLWREWVNAAR